MLNNTDCYLYERIEDVKFNIHLLIATAWETAYFVKEYLHISVNNVKPFYFIQNSEDEASFSGPNSSNAAQTYNFVFKKIVINKRVRQRFTSESPLFMHVGFNAEFYRLINPLSDRNSITFPLRRGDSKGARYAMECIEKMRSSGFKGKIIGFGDYKSEELPSCLGEKIKYYYKPSNEMLLKIYNDSRIFVLPSVIEGMPLPPLEAMSCGSAVIVTDNGGTNEYIEDGLNGLLCPVRDSNCLFEKIMYLEKNENIRLEIAAEGIQTSSQYSYQKMTKRFYDIVKKYL